MCCYLNNITKVVNGCLSPDWDFAFVYVLNTQHLGCSWHCQWHIWIGSSEGRVSGRLRRPRKCSQPSYKNQRFVQNYRCCSFAKSCPTLCDPIDCSTAGSSFLHYLPELAQIVAHGCPLLPPSPPALNLSQHQGLFQQVGPLHQVAKVLEFQHQYFQRIFRVDFL